MPTSDDVGGEIPRKIIEGKTKIVYSIPDHPGMVRIVAKDDLTAGDGARKDSFPGKGVLATRTNRNVFELLRESNIPVAYSCEISESEYEARQCTMLPYEVVIQRQVAEKSSARKRDMELKTGTRFDALKVFFFLKTTGPVFKGIEVPKDDPLITMYSSEGVVVCHPHLPLDNENPRVSIPGHVLFTYGQDPFRMMEELARRVFLVLEKAWMLHGYKLLDLKIEFGFDPDGDLVVADVITNDEWRLLDHLGRHRDKQLFRDGRPIEEIIEAYEEVATVSDRFRCMNGLPTIILWRGSEKDLIQPFRDELIRLGSPAYFEEVVCSMHKATRVGLDVLDRVVAELGSRDAVIIAHVGLSNGLGPSLKGNTTIPVIAVPVDEKDVDSSLRLPSDLPMMTIMRPENAIQAAVEIFALRSPHAYMARRYVMESYWLNRENSPSFEGSF